MYAHLYDAQGNAIATSGQGIAYDINGDMYVFNQSADMLAKVLVYTVEDTNYFKCTCSKFYPVDDYLQYYYDYIYNERPTSCQLMIDPSSFTTYDDGTYSFNVLPNTSPTNCQIYGTALMYPCKEGTSQDYDFSVVYGGQDAFIQINPDYLCISKEQYDTAVDTVNEILGEEV
jgi:hypothetical protein